MGRELPILFNTDMVQAILDGRKTVTRRICRDGNDYSVPDMQFFDAEKRTYAVHNYADKEHRESVCLVEKTCPVCPDDILYVRETWSYDVGGIYIYKASYAETFTENKQINAVGNKIKWYPSIHMPKEAARIWLKVTDVRVERLRDITEAQAVKEGISRLYDDMSDMEYLDWTKRTGIYPKAKKEWGYKNYLWHGNFGMHGTGNKMSDAWRYQCSSYDSAKDSFSSLWNATVPLKDWNVHGWDANPWVLAIEFERCEKPAAGLQNNEPSNNS